MHWSYAGPVWGAHVKSAIPKAAASVTMALTVLLTTASPAAASSGATLAAQPWHYWIAWVMLLSALGVLLVALPLGYYQRVYRLKHPRQK
jgi:hypothetical protein